jgi:hypothetical protein
MNNFNLNELPIYDYLLFYFCKSNINTLMVTVNVNCELLSNRENNVVIDPEEKKFIEFYV